MTRRPAPPAQVTMRLDGSSVAPFVGGGADEVRESVEAMSVAAGQHEIRPSKYEVA
jgi:hypothetical protein